MREKWKKNKIIWNLWIFSALQNYAFTICGKNLWQKFVAKFCEEICGKSLWLNLVAKKNLVKFVRKSGGKNFGLNIVGKKFGKN
jgi:hypothetical protein